MFSTSNARINKILMSQCYVQTKKVPRNVFIKHYLRMVGAVVTEQVTCYVVI